MCFYLVISSLGGLITVGGDAPSDGIGIYVRSNGIHTDLIFPTETEFYDWKDFIPTEPYPNNSSFDYIAIGWGDRGFFINTPTWDDLTAKTFFTAVLINSPTAMHVEYFDNKPSETNDCKYVLMERSKYPDLVEYTRETFKRSNDEVELIPASGYWTNDNFYEANGNYHMFRTCNRWTNVALKIAGIKTGVFSLFSEGIMRHLD